VGKILRRKLVAGEYERDVDISPNKGTAR
jgi:hypothetical protein